MVERDVMEYDFAIVGAGPAGLACALRLRQLAADKTICVLEKGSQVGAHLLSGAVMQPDALDTLLPDWREDKPALCVPAGTDEFFILTKNRRFRMPTPPQMHNRGNFILSLGQLCKKLAERAEAMDIDVFPGFAAASALFNDNGAVRGIRVGDMGLEKNGEQGANFTPGVDIHAGTTFMAEGCRGSTTKQLIKHFDLDAGKSPQTYGLGIKELWQLKEGHGETGLIQHTVGWPLDNKTYGGSFVYHLDNDRVYVGFVAGLDYEDPNFEPFEAFQQFKHHPSVRPMLEGGEIMSYGARALIEGGFQSLPRMDMPGAVLLGDAAGTLNVPKIKGIHTAIQCGMMAAEHVIQHQSSHGFDVLFRASKAGVELKKVRNIRPGFRRGLLRGLVNAAWESVTLGKSPWTLKNHADWSSLKKLDEITDVKRHWSERDLPPRDRLSSVFFATIEHDENQPVHLHVADTSICVTRCAEEYGNPCTRFCPAHVYEIVDEDDGTKRLQINAANCVHCKACDIKDPYEIINWVTPEGGSGPNYNDL